MNSTNRMKIIVLALIVMSMVVSIKAGGGDKGGKGKGGRDIIILGGGHKKSHGYKHQQHAYWYPYFIPYGVPIKE